MGILVQDNGERSRLQSKITADLREKARRSSGEGERRPDFVEDSEYTRNYKKTGRFGWFWFVLIFFAIISLIIIFGLK